MNNRLTMRINSIKKYQIIRYCRFAPYLKNKGPTFQLTLFDTYLTDDLGKYILGYRLTMRENRKQTLLFQGTDFGNSPLHAIDSDSTVKALMCFLCLKPGDTDREYFAGYSETQLNFCNSHAETLYCTVCNRFG